MIRLCNNRGVTEVSYDFNHIAPFTYPNIKDFFHKMLDHLFLGMMAQTPCPSEKVIQRAINYIDIHYKRNITLSEVANFVHLNPHYLSRLFKQKLNQTFVNYITERRINHAKNY